MHLEDLILIANDDFTLKEPTGDIGALQFTSKFLDKLKQYGVEIHYELHYSDGSDNNLIRICCHAYPYRDFANGLHNTKEQYVTSLQNKYGDEKTQKILSFRDAIKNDYIAFGNEYSGELDYHKRNDVDYLDLVCKSLADTLTDDELISQVYSFIGETYGMLILKINDNLPLLK